MEKKYADYLLKNTRENYDKIAEEFSRTRAVVWTDILPLAKYAEPGDKILDLGCGNGRLLELFQDKNIEYIGADNSEKLIVIAREKANNINQKVRTNFIVADALKLPFPDNYFDKIYSIAVFHHIPSEEYRLEFLREVKRVLKQDGLLILTVWNLWSWKNFPKLLFPSRWNNPRLVVKYTLLKILGRSKLDFKDAFVPWGKTCQRYIHQFTQRGLKNLVSRASFAVQEIGVLPRPEMKDSNIYLVAKK